jgi:hypothetical protein
VDRYLIEIELRLATAEVTRSRPCEEPSPDSWVYLSDCRTAVPRLKKLLELSAPICDWFRGSDPIPKN